MFPRRLRIIGRKKASSWLAWFLALELCLVSSAVRNVTLVDAIGLRGSFNYIVRLGWRRDRLNNLVSIIVLRLNLGTLDRLHIRLALLRSHASASR